jgi:uncharacterized protein (DUF342 family)
MKGITLSISDDKKKLLISVDTLLFESTFSFESLTTFINTCDAKAEFSEFTLSEDSVLELSDEITLAIANDSNDLIECVIGDIKQASITVSISDDKMSAILALVKHSRVGIPDLADLMENVTKRGVIKGVSRKRLNMLRQQLIDAQVAEEVSYVIAKGLPPRKGKDSWIKPLVPNALERLLAPQKKQGTKVDMRNLGHILCVSTNNPIAIREAPTEGRAGMTVTGEKIPSSPGQLIPIKLGTNTCLAPDNENSVIAEINGQPKFNSGVMSVDDTFTASKGVNVGTGNIQYDGAVIISGDVTENMEVIATGDVTVNGFVESAFIRSGGDIIITQGATGKMHDEDCQLIASGNIFIQHAQGLDIVAGKNLSVARQLAYSRVKVKGTITVGAPDNPMGNLFASTLNCESFIKAGSIGAVSGSALTIDFSDGYNSICKKQSALVSLFKKISASNASQEVTISAINNKNIPPALTTKLLALNNELDAQRILLNWLGEAQIEVQARRLEYEKNAHIVANKQLFPGVTVKLNKKIWRSDREHLKCKLTFDKGNWLFGPLV